MVARKEKRGGPHGSIIGMLSHSFREMVDYTNNQVEQDFMRRWRFCSILVFHVCDMLSSRLSLDIYALF